MNKSLFLIALSCFTSFVFAELPPVPAQPIGTKKELLFSDDFEREDLGDKWGKVVPTFTVEKGALKGTQTRVDAPAQEGKPAVKGHQAVTGTDVPTKDSIIELKFKFAGATALSVEFDDRKFTGSHYGHICYCRMSLKGISLSDQKEGSMRNDIYTMTDPSKKAEKAKLLEGKTVTYPITFETDKWYNLQLETVGDSMRASIDGKPVAFIKSPGIAHETKSKIELGCAGHDGYFDEIKIYNAAPAK